MYTAHKCGGSRYLSIFFLTHVSRTLHKSIFLYFSPSFSTTNTLHEKILMHINIWAFFHNKTQKPLRHQHICPQSFSIYYITIDRSICCIVLYLILIHIIISLSLLHYIERRDGEKSLPNTICIMCIWHHVSNNLT